MNDLPEMAQRSIEERPVKDHVYDYSLGFRRGLIFLSRYSPGNLPFTDRLYHLRDRF